MNRKTKTGSFTVTIGNLPLSCSVALNCILFLSCMLLLAYKKQPTESTLSLENVSFQGGHPVGTKRGTCYCSGEDLYCMCNPSLAIDLVIFSGTEHIWLVRRKDTKQLATMGGFVMVGETVREAVDRELLEEMGLTLKNPPSLFGVYSDPRRDNRRHVASVVFAVHLDGTEKPKPADDVLSVERIAVADVIKMPSKDFYDDHSIILHDYFEILKGKKKHAHFDASPDAFAPDIARSICLPIEQ